jgi:hypothetical protein
VGYFDSECRISGLSLGQLPVVCLPLRAHGEALEIAGEPVHGRSDRLGGIDGEMPPAPYALVAEPIHRALLDLGRPLASWLRPLGPLGGQHADGDVLARYVRARELFRDAPAIGAAIDACAALDERATAQRFRTEAPPAGWLLEGGASWYGVVVGAERRASTTREGLRRDLVLLAGWLFDSDTLARTGEAASVLAVVRGRPHEIPIDPLLQVVSGPDRARPEDAAAAEAVFGTFHADIDPHFEIDEAALARSVPEIEAPHAIDGREVVLGWDTGTEPAWAGRVYGGALRFARVVRDGFVRPPPRA